MLTRMESRHSGDTVQVLVILCALVSSSLSLDTNGTAVPCDITLQDDNSYTVNCTRRSIARITSWPEQMNDIDKDAHVLITFFNNSISTVLQIPSVPGVELALNFKHNHITQLEDEAFAIVSHLVYLDLSNNGITGEKLKSAIFRGPFDKKSQQYSSIKLQRLCLGYNKVDSLEEDLFQYTPNLTQLYLNNNPIRILDDTTIRAMSKVVNLKILDLSNTDIDKIPLNAFKDLVNLQQIDLSGNRFVDVPESLSLVGSSLEYLTFNNNPLVELNDDSFIGLTNLKELEVGENDYLEEVKRSTFTPLVNLRVLHLCHNRNLRYISHNAFNRLKNNWTLLEVYLDDNNLSELSTDLMPWNKLETLGMTGNSWLCNCDLATIVTKQGAGTKFKAGEIPYCAQPMRLSGAYVTNITVTFCPTFDTTLSKKGFSISDLKPKHVLWSIFGVATVVCIGMLIGLLVNLMKTFYNNKIRNHQPIRYINLNADAGFA